MSEDPHAKSADLDSMSTRDLLEVMNAEDARAMAAVRSRLADVARAVDLIAARLREGGRLHYFGAGTSGRLAALDAAECGPTFGIDAGLVSAHCADDGAAEDDRALGMEHVTAAKLSSRDAAVLVSASGTTPYVLGAAEQLRSAGTLVVALACADGSPLARAADVAIEIDAGPEVIAGSTRLKAGTVQKVVLNMLSTGVFTRLGHTYRGRMVGVAAANDKQRGRAVRQVAELTGVSRQEAERALARSDWSSKVAILVLRCGMSADAARSRLSEVDGDLAAALGERQR
jgi:N-acetylmuramic acid 6-phosphate etherase